MKIGMIGIGDIARKAYLPILGTRSDIELSIASRNQEVVDEVGRQYRIRNQFSTVQELISSNIDAAFVHTSTDSHADILRQLIAAGIHVFIDKPIAYSLHESEEVVSLAQQHKVKLMVGFNRRFMPMYKNAKETIPTIETAFMQKNRIGPVSPVRQTVFDDFIHVVDTLLYYVGKPETIMVNGKVEDGLLHYLVLNLMSQKTTGLGMMNRQTGITEERLEIMGCQHKIVVQNCVHTTTYANHSEQHSTFGDWISTLYRRGFVDMIDHFIECIQSGNDFLSSGEKSLQTHRICEDITQQLERL
ncbi:Gfo/Idh/MocA family oxidoreductase [Paenibacillus alvei]|uniref:Gfo/Idh/MocA family oxidoreductase n=1 Tax=Paenibacillus alvei TaxID=44250 RepID=A0ABT4H451_PAEAL|nr:Gfo/Idh/MocA family oxidoreductase [Paenibacillus alvei]MCY9763755.1 Gfo/Idh/MocA family oxidoreductase [Paenibacillus alvei]MCY9769989.1 Gfo/Idh/MocA family oxidoreductase [Paenibacillus alvei]